MTSTFSGVFSPVFLMKNFNAKVFSFNRKMLCYFIHEGFCHNIPNFCFFNRVSDIQHSISKVVYFIYFYTQ